MGNVATSEQIPSAIPSGLHLLPASLKLAVAEYLDTVSLCRVSVVSREWHQIANNERIWQRHFNARWGKLDPQYLRLKGSSFKLYYGQLTVQQRKRTTQEQGLLARFASLLYKKKDMRVILIGFEGSGKTTILYKLKLGETLVTVPSIAFQVETVEYKRTVFTIWDVKGSARGLWKHYYANCNAIVFVVDAADRGPLPSIKEELHKVMKDPDLANDMENAVSPAELIIELDLESLTRPWLCAPSCALDGSGIHDGFDWILQYRP